MKQYLDLLEHVLVNGAGKDDRTGTGTRAVFGYQFRHDLRTGFPLLTTKKIFTKGVIAELLWFLNGDTNVKTLQDQGVHIWDAWANEDGTLGPVYGSQWRSWEGKIDQISNLVEGINKNPNSRRHIVTAWNPSEIHLQKLPPCHPFWQCQVVDGVMNLSLYMRSCDSFLGAPFNIASYALLLSMLAKVTGLKAGELITSYGDLHIYNNHIEQVKLQLSRETRRLPSLVIHGDQKTIFDFKLEDFEFIGYDPHPAIKAPIAV